MAEARRQALERLQALVGEWRTVASNHRMSPEMEAHGTTRVEWLAGEQFLVVRSQTEDPYPDSLTVIGLAEGEDRFTWDYYDSRGVHRTAAMDLRDGVWTIWRDDPAFGQRFVGRFGDTGDTIIGEWLHATDGAPLAHDFDLTFRRIR